MIRLGYFSWKEGNVIYPLRVLTWPSENATNYIFYVCVSVDAWEDIWTVVCLCLTWESQRMEVNMEHDTAGINISAIYRHERLE